jgi:hypothetical protein
MGQVSFSMWCFNMVKSLMEIEQWDLVEDAAQALREWVKVTGNQDDPVYIGVLSVCDEAQKIARGNLFLFQQAIAGKIPAEISSKILARVNEVAASFDATPDAKEVLRRMRAAATAEDVRQLSPLQRWARLHEEFTRASTSSTNRPQTGCAVVLAVVLVCIAVMLVAI